MAPGVCVRKCQMLLKLDLYRCGLNKTFAASFHQLLQKEHRQFQPYNNHHHRQLQPVHRQNRRHEAFGIVVATDPWHRIAAKGYCTGTSSSSESGEQQNPSSSASEAQLLITVWSFLLPPVRTSIYFHQEQPSEEQIELKSDKHQPASESTCSRATTLLWSHFKCAYTNFTVIRYSLWSAIAGCCMNQIISYVQALWSTIGGPDTVFWNGAVDAVFTLTGSLVALLAGYVPQKYLKLGITLPSLSMTAILEGIALFMATVTSNLTVAYASHILIGMLNSFVGPLITSEIAKRISNDSFALVFGVSSVVGLTVQSIFTLAVVDSNGWFALDIRGQFAVCSYIFIGIGLLYAIFLVDELCRRRKSKEKQRDASVADQEM